MRLRLGKREFPDGALLTMAIVNRTPDSFYDRGATWDEHRAYDRVRQVIDEGADIVDIGGVKAAPGAEVTPAEETRRVVEFIANVRAEHPQAIISVDTWRSEVGREACLAGADLINDSWAGSDPALAEVAAEFGVGLVCTHTGGATPRTRPYRVHYDDVVADVIERTTALADRAERAGVDPAGILIDPTHDFGKNTWHSLELTRRLNEIVAGGRPVLVSLSNKDFIGETLDLPVGDRVEGSLAATAICAWLGARVFRVHQVRESRRVLDMVATIMGRRVPARTVRGLV
jgi:dihydropteroate synthase